MGAWRCLTLFSPAGWYHSQDADLIKRRRKWGDCVRNAFKLLPVIACPDGDDFWYTDTSSLWRRRHFTVQVVPTAQPWNQIEQLRALSGVLLLSSSVVQEGSRTFCIFSWNMQRCWFCRVHANLSLASFADVNFHGDNFVLGFLKFHNWFCSAGLDWNFCNNKFRCFLSNLVLHLTPEGMAHVSGYFEGVFGLKTSSCNLYFAVVGAASVEYQYFVKTWLKYTDHKSLDQFLLTAFIRIWPADVDFDQFLFIFKA